MNSLRDYWRLDADIGWADKARILAAYLAVGLGFAVIAVFVLARTWPYTGVTFDGETAWVGEAPVVQIGTVADVTFTVPMATNEGYPVTFHRSLIQQRPGPYFEWPLGDPILHTYEEYAADDLPVRVVFPVVYMPGTYVIQITTTYQPNLLSSRSVTFTSPPLTVAEP